MSKEFKFADHIYIQNLTVINEIEFSQREIDIIAILLSGKSSKEIASFLSIAPKTVDSFLFNIMKRLKVKTRNDVIYFVKKSSQIIHLQEYCAALPLKIIFEKQVKSVSKLIKDFSSSCTIAYGQKDETELLLIQLVKEYLNLAGIKTFLKIKDNKHSISEFINLTKAEQNSYTIFIISSAELKQLSEEKINKLTDNHLFYEKNIFLLLNSEKQPDLPKKLQNLVLLNPLNSQQFCFCVLEILNKLLPHINFTSIKSELEQQTLHPCIFLEDKPFSLKFNAIYKLKSILGFFQFKRLNWILITLLSISAFSIPWYMIKEFRDKKTFISSDLSFPATEGFLERPKLNMILKNKFKDLKGIQTISLVGIGGSGKTTLARYHARQENTSIIWEINAETKNTLMNSFEALAYALDEEKRILNIIREIKNTQEREERLFLFIKKKLKSHQNWFLIYDNVEEFSDIQNYFPSDHNVWGAGRIIITSRNRNIENNEHINHTIYMGELEPEEKLDLFLKIKKNTNYYRLDSDEIKKVNSFLTEIPSFPLDVSIAAHYLKTTNITYEEYLKYLIEVNKKFINNQELILKNKTKYKQTRFSIITLSLNKIIDNNTDFKELLLLISMLDSQNIPKDLLNNLKNSTIVDNFIIQLKRYSLIDNKLSPTLGSVLSIHRSTQSIIFKYMLEKFHLSQDSQISRDILKTFEAYMDNIIKSENFPMLTVLIDHGLALLNREFLFDNTSMARIRGELGYIYYLLTNYQSALYLLQQNKSFLVEKKLQDNTVFARTLTYLGILDWLFGHLEKSLELFQASEMIHKKSNIKDYWGMAKNLIYLGIDYFDMGQDEKSKVSLEKALHISNKYLAENHLEKAFALSYLGFLYGGADLKKSKSYLEESLEIYNKHSTHNHVKFAWTLVHLASYHSILGNYKKAKDLNTQALKIYEDHYPRDSTNVAWALRNSGSSYCSLGNTKIANQLLERSFRIFKNSMGIDNIKTKWVLFELGLVHKKEGALEKAKEVFEDCLINYTKQYGEDNINIARILKNLGEIYLLKEDLENAEYYLKKALIIYENGYDFYSYATLESLADIYLKKSTKQQEVDFRNQAIIYLNKALEIITKYYPQESPHFIRIQSKLARTALKG